MGSLDTDLEMSILKKYFPSGSSKGKNKPMQKLSLIPIREMHLLSPVAKM